jgi:hypothetical protein
MNEGCIANWQCDGNPSAHQPTLARLKFEAFAATQIRSSVAGMRVRRQF